MDRIIRKYSKYLVMGFCFTTVILLAMYKRTSLDYINESVMYMPLFAMILTTILNLEIYEIRMEEIYYAANIKKIRTYIRKVLTILLIEASIIVYNYILYMAMFNIGFEHSIEKRLYFEAVFISMFYITSLTMFMCSLLKKKTLVLCVVSLVWIYWIINATQVSTINPFVFVADPGEYENLIISQIIVSIFLLLGAFLIESKGPFWVKEIFSSRAIRKRKRIKKKFEVE